LHAPVGPPECHVAISGLSDGVGVGAFLDGRVEHSRRGRVERAEKEQVLSNACVSAGIGVAWTRDVGAKGE
jgi:hypothetical protein